MEANSGMNDSLKKSADNIYENNVYESRPSWDDTWLSVAHIIAKRSLCSTQVGAVIVDTRNRPISMGYNGPPAGFDHENKWCSHWCDRGNIPNEYQQTGITPKHPAYYDCPSLHAEQNALITADKANFTGGTIYVNGHLCGTCAKLIANSGLKRVVIGDDKIDRSYREYDKWYEFLRAFRILVHVTLNPNVIGTQIIG